MLMIVKDLRIPKAIKSVTLFLFSHKLKCVSQECKPHFKLFLLVQIEIREVARTS